MNRTVLIPLMAMLPVPGIATAQNFAGDYTLQDSQGKTVMSIQQDPGGKISGGITMDDGFILNLQGEIRGKE